MYKNKVFLAPDVQSAYMNHCYKCVRIQPADKAVEYLTNSYD